MVEDAKEPTDLLALARQLLDQAGQSTAGRAARTLTTGAGIPLKQSLLALKAGTALQEHAAPGIATIQVLIGAGRLISNGTTTPLLAGEWAAIPDAPHSLEAAEDLAALLTVGSA